MPATPSATAGTNTIHMPPAPTSASTRSGTKLNTSTLKAQLASASAQTAPTPGTRAARASFGPSFSRRADGSSRVRSSGSSSVMANAAATAKADVRNRPLAPMRP